DRAILFSRYYEDNDIAQIAESLGVAQNTIAKRLSRAVNRLRQRMAAKGAGTIDAAVVCDLFTRMTRQPAAADTILKVTKVASGQLAASTVSQLLVTGVLNMMRSLQIKIAAATLGVVILGAGSVIILSNAPAQPVGSAPAAQPAEKKSEKEL